MPPLLVAVADSVFPNLDLARAVVSRAGAMTIAELAAAGKAAVVIPFPAAADRHQLENARALERAGAGASWAATAPAKTRVETNAARNLMFSVSLDYS